LKFFLAMSKGIDDFTTIIGKLMWWLTLFMVLVGVYNVLTRYGFHYVAAVFGQAVAEKASGNTYLELQTYSYNLVFLLGAAYVFRSDGHVRVDVVFTNLPPRVKAWIDILATILFLLPFCLMGIYFSHHYVAASWRVHEMSPNPGGLARYPIKTVIVIAFALLIAQGLSEIIKNVAFLTGRRDSRSMYATLAEERPDDSAVHA
jgi:TRAP-type mannitol/chloroaromatic compound transport system permease small subunit